MIKMKNFVQEGKVMDYLNAGSAVASGDVVVLPAGIGVAVVDISTDASGSVKLEGVFELAKAAEAFDQGDKLYWDASAKKLTKTSSGNTPAGVAFKAALSGDAEGLCKLTL